MIDCLKDKTKALIEFVKLCRKLSISKNLLVVVIKATMKENLIKKSLMTIVIRMTFLINSQHIWLYNKMELYVKMIFQSDYGRGY